MTNHVIQCGECSSIVDFFLTEENEEPAIFYTKKCHRCIGSIDDENQIQPFKYPDILM